MIEPKIVLQVLDFYLKKHYPEVEITFENHPIKKNSVNVKFIIPKVQINEVAKFLSEFMSFSYIMQEK